MNKKSGLADSPFFRLPIYEAPPSGKPQPTVSEKRPINGKQERPPKVQTLRLPDKQSSSIPDSQTPRVPDKQTSRLPDFEDYDIPDYRKMQRIEVRLTWEQNKYLDDMEALIGRDVPEGDKSDPQYRRITKNSIIRVMAEILRCSDLQVDASQFRNERDLLKAMVEALKTQFAKAPSSRLPE